jgi:hypothetical protein
MTPSELRTIVATQAMAGWLASSSPYQPYSEQLADSAAKDAVGFADALLQRLEQTSPQVQRSEICRAMSRLSPETDLDTFNRAVDEVCLLLESRGLLKEDGE